MHTFVVLCQRHNVFLRHFMHVLHMHVPSLCVCQCAEEEATRALVLEHGGLEPLALLLKKTDNKELLCAVTGAVWKCSKSSQIATKYEPR